MTGAADEPPLRVIEPSRGLIPVSPAELWSYRELLYFLVWRNVKVRYKQTLLGAAWAIVQPLAMAVIFTLVFGDWSAIAPDGSQAYTLRVLVGMVLWSFVSTSVAGSTSSLVDEARLLTRVYFPRLFVPLVPVVTSLVDLALSLSVALLAIVARGAAELSARLLILPLAILALTVLVYALGLILSALSAFWRDFRYVVPFLLQTWFFATPIVYPPELVSPQNRWLVELNPLTPILQAFRAALLGDPLSVPAFGLSGLAAVSLLLVALMHFRRVERRLADVV